MHLANHACGFIATEGLVCLQTAAFCTVFFFVLCVLGLISLNPVDCSGKPQNHWMVELGGTLEVTSNRPPTFSMRQLTQHPWLTVIHPLLENLQWRSVHNYMKKMDPCFCLNSHVVMDTQNSTKSQCGASNKMSWIIVKIFFGPGQSG